MKKYLIYMMIFSSQTVSSQTYLPFPEANAQWNCFYSQYWFNGADYGYDSDRMTYMINGDTTIGANTYVKLIKIYEHTQFWFTNNTPHTFQWVSGWSFYDGGYRNDSVNKKVIFLPVDSLNEKILYDFSVQTGDTIRDWWCLYSPSFPEVVVDSIDSVLVDNTYHRRINITQTGAGPVSIIEGIGSTAGLLNPLSYFENTGSLECFRLNNRTLFPDTGIACGIITSVNIVQPQPVNIFPNPSAGFFNFSGIENNSTIIICNFSGERVNVLHCKNGPCTLDLRNYPRGIYFCELVQNNNRPVISKLIIQ